MFDWHDHQAIQKLVYNSELYTLVHLSFRPDDRVSHVWIYTLSANRINTGFGFPVVHKSRKSHPSQIRLVHNNNRSPGRMESCWKEAPEGFSRTACSHLTMLPVCLGTLQWHLLSNGSNWQSLAREKRFLVGTRLTCPGVFWMHFRQSFWMAMHMRMCSATPSL